MLLVFDFILLCGQTQIFRLVNLDKARGVLFEEVIEVLVGKVLRLRMRCHHVLDGNGWIDDQIRLIFPMSRETLVAQRGWKPIFVLVSDGNPASETSNMEE